MFDYEDKRAESSRASYQPPDDRIDKLNSRYRMLCEMGQAVTSEMNLDVLFDLIMRQTTRIMVCEQASVFLFDPGCGQLCSKASTDLKSDSVRISPGSGITGWVFRTASPLIVNDPYGDPRFFSGVDKVNGFRTRNIICTPLVNRKKQCIGTLQALNKKTGKFDVNDLEMLKVAANYVTIAFKNARLYEELKALDKAKEKVINHLSHEIKTPLSVIGGVLHHVSERIAIGNISKVERALARGKRNVKRLKLLQDQIDDILICRESFTSNSEADVCQVAFNPFEEVVEQGTDIYSSPVNDISKRNWVMSMNQMDKFLSEEVGLTEFLKGICHHAVYSMGDRNICIVQEYDKHAILRIDRRVLKIVCTGLLKNAIENTPDSGLIKVTVENCADEIRITFKDYGVGITSINQKMIFGGFFPTQPTVLYSSKNPYDFNAGGTGADLLRIKTFSKRLGFEVEFSSKRCPFLPRDRDVCPGKISLCRFVESKAECLINSGSTFIVRFPRQRKTRDTSSINTLLPNPLQFKVGIQ